MAGLVLFFLIWSRDANLVKYTTTKSAIVIGNPILVGIHQLTLASSGISWWICIPNMPLSSVRPVWEVFTVTNVNGRKIVAHMAKNSIFELDRPAYSAFRIITWLDNWKVNSKYFLQSWRRRQYHLYCMLVQCYDPLRVLLDSLQILFEVLHFQRNLNTVLRSGKNRLEPREILLSAFQILNPHKRKFLVE